MQYAPIDYLNFKRVARARVRVRQFYTIKYVTRDGVVVSRIQSAHCRFPAKSNTTLEQQSSSRSAHVLI